MSKSLSARLQDEFPRGWWRSPRWWWAGIRDIAKNCAIALATVCFSRQALRVVRHRNHPDRLQQVTGSLEAWLAAFLINAIGVGLAIVVFGTREGAPPAVVGMLPVLWSAANTLVALAVLIVIISSRIRQRADWVEQDFVEEHLPRGGRPPETIDEYTALRMRQAQNDHR